MTQLFIVNYEWTIIAVFCFFSLQGGIKSCMQEAAANRLSQRQPAVTPAQPVEERHKWMTWAAVGVGAFVVGALLSR